MQLNDRVMVLVVEDDQLIQVMVDEALSDGGFESTITASGEEAVSFLRDDKSVYRAVVSDINLAGKLDGWGSCPRRQRRRSGHARSLYDRNPGRRPGRPRACPIAFC
jgi:DNA-binding response OmpR family regulator